MYPRADLSFAENFLLPGWGRSDRAAQHGAHITAAHLRYMMFATPMEEYQVNPVCAKAINAFMILHMDHAAYSKRAVSQSHQRRFVQLKSSLVAVA